MSEWREIAEWDWVLRNDEGDHLLHAVGELDNEDTVDDEWIGLGITACGIPGHLSIPGLFSRMGSERCGPCCDTVGMPRGSQSPKNIDECRPVAERRIKATL